MQGARGMSLNKKWMHASALSLLSCVPLFVAPWTVAHQAPLSLGIIQGRILEGVSMPPSREPSPSRDRTWVSCVSCIAGRFFTTGTTWEDPRNGCVHAKPLQSCLTLWDPGSSVHGTFQQEYWSGLPCLSPGHLPTPGIESMALPFPHKKAGSLPPAPPGKPQEMDACT